MSFAFFGKKVNTEEERAKRQGETGDPSVDRRSRRRRKENHENDAFPLPKSLAGHPITKDYVAGANVKVKSILDDRCGKCHAEEGLEGKKALAAYPDFASALVVPQVGHTNRQMTVEHLTQTTHLHLLSFCVLWMLTGLIFAFTSYPTSVRCILAPVVLLRKWRT